MPTDWHDRITGDDADTRSTWIFSTDPAPGPDAASVGGVVVVSDGALMSEVAKRYGLAGRALLVSLARVAAVDCGTLPGGCSLTRPLTFCRWTFALRW